MVGCVLQWWRAHRESRSVNTGPEKHWNVSAVGAGPRGHAEARAGGVHHDTGLTSLYQLIQTRGGALSWRDTAMKKNRREREKERRKRGLTVRTAPHHVTQSVPEAVSVQVSLQNPWSWAFHSSAQFKAQLWVQVIMGPHMCTQFVSVHLQGSVLIDIRHKSSGVLTVNI